MIRITRLTRNPKSARQPPEPTQLPSFTTRRSTCSEVMEDLTTSVSLSTTCTPSTSSPSSGTRLFQTTTPLREEEVTQSLHPKTRSISMVDGTLSNSSIVSGSSTCRPANGLTQIFSTISTDGTTVQSLSKPFLLGNSSSSVESVLSTMKELPELLVNMSIPVATLILEPTNGLLMHLIQSYSLIFHLQESMQPWHTTRKTTS